MGGSSESVTVGYKYYVGMHMALCHGPVDKLVRVRVGGNKAWVGNNTGGPLSIDKPDLFGGEKREGGVSGQVDIEMGGPTQGQNSYLASKLGAELLPAFRGVCCAVLRQIYFGLNPYPKDWAWLAQRIRIRENGAAQWYGEKAAIGYYQFVDIIPPLYEEETVSLNSYDIVVPDGSLPDVFYVTGSGVRHDPTKQERGLATATWNGAIQWSVGSIKFSFTLHKKTTGDDSAIIVFTDKDGNEIYSFYPYDGDRSGRATFNGVNVTSAALDISKSYDVQLEQINESQVSISIMDGSSVVGSITISGSIVGVRGYWFGRSFTGVAARFLDITSVSYGQVVIRQYLSTPGEDRYGTCSDMNPAHIIRECLTDATWGMGYSESENDDDASTLAADTLFSEGMGISLLWNQQISIEDFVDDILRHIDGALYVDRSTGKFVLKLIRGGYDESSLLVLNRSNVSRVENYTKQTMAELANEVTVSYDSQETGQIETVTMQNLAMIQQQGAVIPSSVEYMGFANQAIAAKACARDLRALSTPLASATLYANRTAAGLNIGDVFVWEWIEEDEDGAGVTTSYVMRVTEIAFGDGIDNSVRIQCVQDVFALPDITYVEAEPTIWENPSVAPLAATPRLVTETPYYEIVRKLGEVDAAAKISGLPELGYLMVSAGRQSSEINAELQVDSGAGYFEGGTLDFCPSAKLDGAIGRLDTTAAVKDGVDLDEFADGSLAQIDEEIIVVESITEGVATIRRGCLDTVPALHADGAAVIVWDGYSASDSVEYVVSDEVDVKILTVTGQGPLALAEAPVDSVVMDQRALRPYRPAGLAAGGNMAPDREVQVAFPLTITWAHRNRLQETGGSVLAWSAASVTVESGVTYRFHVQELDLLGDLIGTAIDETVSGTSRIIADTDFSVSAVYLRITVTAQRDGLDSWQSPTIEVGASIPAGNLIIDGADFIIDGASVVIG